MISNDLRQSALDRLDAGLELCITRDECVWQMPSRTALRFAVSREDAERIYQAFKHRFHTRVPIGSRRYLTPEPRQEQTLSVAHTALPRKVGGGVELTSPWYTVQALGMATALTEATVRRGVREWDLFTRLEAAPQGGRYDTDTLIVIYADDRLGRYLESKHLYGRIEHRRIQIEFDGRKDRVVLRKDWYTLQQLADVVGKTYNAVYGYHRRHPDLLTTDTRRVTGAAHTCTCVKVDTALVTTIQDVWNRPVVIENDTSFDGNET